MSICSIESVYNKGEENRDVGEELAICVFSQRPGHRIRGMGEEDVSRDEDNI